MARLHLLGTGAALSSPERTTTMLAFEGATTIVVDCGGDVVQRLLASDIDLATIELLILTHQHPDHVGGFPLFMEKIWLAQRDRPIPVSGPPQALDQARRTFATFDTSGWTGLPEIEWREISLEENAEVWNSSEWRVTSSPGRHGVPVIGVRVESLDSGRAVVYSADTEACPEIARLARDAAILVHEATGDFPGHTSASGAAELAREAAVERLVLAHLPPFPDEEDLEEAADIFPGLELGRDGARYDF